MQIEIEECQSRLRRTSRDSGVLNLAQFYQGGGYHLAHECVIDGCSNFYGKFIAGDVQNGPYYSSGENINVVFFPPAYSDSVQLIAEAASTKVCRVRGGKYWDVVGRYPKQLEVEKN